MRKEQEKSTASITFSLYPSEKEEVKFWVKQEDTSISNFVRTAIDFYIKNYLEKLYKTSNEKVDSVE